VSGNSQIWSRCNSYPCPSTIFNIPNLIEDREYEFRVIAVNDAGEGPTSLPSKQVKVRDPNASKAPEIVKGLENMEAKEGGFGTFEIEVKGHPPPEVTWYKGTRELMDSSKYEMRKEGNRYILIVHDIYGEDADEYSVRVKNRGGARTSRADMIIRSKPKIKVPPRFKENAQFDKTEDVVIKIPFTGFPKPTAKWQRNGVDVKSGDKYSIEIGERHAILTIRNADKDDDGPYKLVLENDLGSDSASITIQINDKPDAPRFLQVNDTFHDSVTLSWKPPLHDGGSFVSQYIVEKKEPEMASWIRCSLTRFATCRIENLVPGKEYQFRVMAENLHGRSEPCEPCTTTTEETKQKQHKGYGFDEDGNRIRGKYDGPKITDYDKHWWDFWKDSKPREVEIKTSSVYDFYDVYEELGKGAFGAIHRCVEKATGKTFIAKFVNTPSMHDKITVRNEINMYNNLHHPKLLNLYDAYEDKYEMVMIHEFCSGDEILEKCGNPNYQMSEVEAINYMKQILAGLSAMHEKFIVHLDIKPENILLENNQSTNIKLVDFGFSSKLDPENPVKVSVINPEFSAPEILNRDAVGFYSDMWSIGALTYTLLSGFSPFFDDDEAGTIDKVRSCDWSFDLERFKNISANGKDFIQKLLIKDPLKRMNIFEAMEHPWLTEDMNLYKQRIPSHWYDGIRSRISKRYGDWDKPTPAIGRLANYSSLRKNRTKDHKIFDSFFDRREAWPKFVKKPKACVVKAGNAALYQCRVIALSPPTISWSIGGTGITPSLKYMPKYNGNNYELRVGRCKKEDEGQYSVRAENSYGSAECRVFLHVEEMPEVRSRAFSLEPTSRRVIEFEEIEGYKEPPDRAPHFTFPLRDRYIQHGNNVKLTCTCEAKPHPKMTWMKDGEELLPGQQYTIEYSLGICSLEISSAGVKDSGKFSAKATNSSGSDECVCKVTVSEKISIGSRSSIGSLDTPSSTYFSSTKYNRSASQGDINSPDHPDNLPAKRESTASISRRYSTYDLGSSGSSSLGSSAYSSRTTRSRVSDFKPSYTIHKQYASFRPSPQSDQPTGRPPRPYSPGGRKYNINISHTSIH